MNNEYTIQELIALINAKAIDGKVSLDDFAQIVFDTKFPESLSQHAVEKLKEYSIDCKRFNELGAIILEKTQEAIEYQKQIIELNDKGYINDDDDEKIVGEISELLIKKKEIEDEIKPLEDEFKKLYTFFINIQQS